MFDAANDIVDRGFALPLYASMDDATQDHVLDALDHSLDEVLA